MKRLKKLVSLAVTEMLFTTVPLVAADYFVATTGSDTTGNGTSDNPFATPSKAALVASASGDVIRVAAGTYTETSNILLKSGVSLIGAGATATILGRTTPTFAYFNPNSFFIQLQSSSFTSQPATVSDFAVVTDRNASLAVDANDPNQISGGLVVANRGNVTIRNVHFQKVSWGALWLGPRVDLPAKNILVDGCKFLECGFSSANYVTGAINPAFVEDVEIANFSIVGLEPYSGYGISSIGIWNGGYAPRASWKRVKIHTGDIDLKVTGAWNNGQAPSIAIETNLTWPIENSEIYNCVFRNNVSLVDGGLPQGQPMPPGGWTSFPRNGGIPTIRLHHNKFLMKPRSSGGPGNYVLELSMDDFEFDHNYVEPESWILGGFYFPRTNIKIHHNIFRGGKARWEGASFHVGAKKVSFYNNVMDWTPPGSFPGGGLNAQGGVNPYNWGFVFLTDSGTDDLRIQNNTFQWGGDPSVTVALVPNRVIPNLSISNNFVTGIQIGNAAGSYSNNTAVAPQFKNSGSLPAPWYEAVGAAGNTVNSGTTAGLPSYPFQGSAPDIGAYEFGGNEVIGLWGGVPATGFSAFNLAFAALYSTGNVAGQQGWLLNSGNASAWQIEDGTGPGGNRAFFNNPTNTGNVSRVVGELDFAAGSAVEIVTQIARRTAVYTGTGSWDDSVKILVEKVGSNGSSSQILWFGGNPLGLFRSSGTWEVPGLSTGFKEVRAVIDFATSSYSIELEGVGLHATGTFSSPYVAGDRLRLRAQSIAIGSTGTPQISYKFGAFQFLADGIPLTTSYEVDFNSGYAAGNLPGQQNWSLDNGNAASWKILSGAGPGSLNGLASSATDSGTTVRDIDTLAFSYGSTVTLTSEIARNSAVYTGTGSWGDNLRVVLQKVSDSGAVDDLLWFGANSRGLFRSSASWNVPSLSTTFKAVTATVDFATNTYSIELEGAGVHGTGTFLSSYTSGDYFRLKLINSDAGGTTDPQTSYKFGNFLFQSSH